MAESRATPLRHPTFLLAALIAAGCLIATLSYRLGDPDIWQHLAVGRALWTLHRVPAEHLWTWPTYGQPDVTPSWLYRALLWPFWSAGGTWGAFVFRWLLALAAFAVSWKTARRLGARGLAALLVMVVCVLSYRSRSQLRPEMLVAILLAVEIGLLERRRTEGDRPSVLAGLVVVAWVWANVHLSYFLGLGLIAIHALATSAPGRRGLGARAPLAGALLAATAISFLNPYGWRALVQPFEYWTTWRHDSIYATLPELQSFFAVWRLRLTTGLPALLALWPVLILWRPRGRRFDAAEALTCAMFTTLTLFAQRFAALYAVAAAPYLARDLAAWLGAWRWPERVAAPRARAALVASACVLVCVPSWLDPRYPFGIDFQWANYPVGASDAIARAGIRGRFFNPHYFGGYLLWRFWPEHDRLPFMDIHQSGTPGDRELTGYSLGEPRAWAELDAERHFEVAVIDGHLDWIANYRLPDALDADATWALVFRDDAAQVWVRRSGTNAGVAESLGYRLITGGAPAWAERFRAIATTPEYREIARAELERMSRESSENAWSETQLATFSWLERDVAATRVHLERAIHVAPQTAELHRRLGYVALAEQRPRDAITEFRRELALGTPPLDAYTRIGEAYEALQNRKEAGRWYRRAVAANPDDAAARAGAERTAGS